MNSVPNEFRFNGYPTDHLLGILADAGSMQRLTSKLDTFELPEGAVKVFVGESGARQFGGEHQGLRSWLEEMSRTVAGTSAGYLAYMDALKLGHYVVAVDLQGKPEDKQAVAEAFKAADAQDINFLSKLMVETFE